MSTTSNLKPAEDEGVVSDEEIVMERRFNWRGVLYVIFILAFVLSIGLVYALFFVLFSHDEHSFFSFFI